MLTPPIRFSLAEAIEHIGPEDLVEATPVAIRMRKRELEADARQKVEKRKKREREIAWGLSASDNLSSFRNSHGCSAW